jgi:3-deoxy-D-manno-octulosonate 8-phosphate phosphatase (KDO 8-P phosphatase)
MSSPTLEQRMQRVRALVCDVDGVLTDGALHYTDVGEIKTFSVADGFGIKLAQQAGWQIAFLTARGGPAVVRRAQELGVYLETGQRKKGQALAALAERFDVPLDTVAYMGDDWLDLPAMSRAGLAIAVANAAEAVKAQAHWCLARRGGDGAVREAVEAMLSAQEQLAPLLARYAAEEGQ